MNNPRYIRKVWSDQDQRWFRDALAGEPQSAITFEDPRINLLDRNDNTYLDNKRVLTDPPKR